MPGPTPKDKGTPSHYALSLARRRPGSAGFPLKHRMQLCGHNSHTHVSPLIPGAPCHCPDVCFWTHGNVLWRGQPRGCSVCSLHLGLMPPRLVPTLNYSTFPMTPKATLTETKWNTLRHGWGTWLAKALLRMKLALNS